MYNVIDRPGFFSGNSSKVYGRYCSIKSAKRAMARTRYTDEKGVKRTPTCIVVGEKEKGAIYWGDMYLTIVA